MEKRRTNKNITDVIEKSNLVIPDIERVNEIQPPTAFLSTGCTILDLAIANQLPGGFAVGRVSHIYGPESTAKSVIAQEPLGDAQRRGGEAWFEDVEWTLDGDRSPLFGLDTNSSTFHYEHPETIGELFDKMINTALKERTTDSPPGAMAIDSLSALPSEIEIKEDVEKSGYGTTRARQLSKAFRKYLWKLSQANMALLFIDQTRDDIVGFGKYTVSGGKALRFYSSTRLLLEHALRLKNKNERVIGVKIRFSVEKNKIAPPFRQGTFRLLFDYGIDDIGTNLEWLKENYPTEDKVKKGAWYPFGEKKLGPGLNKACKTIEDNNLEEELRQEVYRVWKEVYRTAERKTKQRE